MRVCAIEDCGKPHEAKGYCKSHYRSLKNHGDPLAGKPKRPSGPCEIEGCDEQARRWGMCPAHSRAFRTHGDATVRVRRERGTGYVQPDGYVMLGGTGHPLASKNGLVYVHRMVLFNKIGPGAHKCHWCGATVRWVLGGLIKGALIADHLDFDSSNNDPPNLVPSCNACNAGRTTRWQSAAAEDGHYDGRLKPNAAAGFLTVGDHARSVDACVQDISG